MADEEVLFEGKGVRITSKRAEIHGTTYAMNGVTSVARRKRAPQNGVALVLVVVGLVGLLSCGGLGGLSFLRTPHQDLADSVATAIESAIVRRG